MPQHQVRFYDSDALLTHALTGYVQEALCAAGAAVVIATPEHRDSLARSLHAAGVDLAAAGDRYRALDAADTLSLLVVDGHLDPGRAEAVLGPLLDAPAPVHVFGEMVALLARSQRYEEALGLEMRWNELLEAHPFQLLCAYPNDLLAEGAPVDLLTEVCALHTHVTPADGFSALTDDDERVREVVRLQQKAHALEFEVAARERAEELLRAALDSAERARRAAEEALRVRDDFLALAAHELLRP